MPMHFVITGASSGIGHALMQQVLQNGDLVSVCARNISELTSSIQHKNLHVMQTDVSNEQNCINFINQSIQKFGPIDILINNAGISMRAPVAEVSTTVLHNVMDINFWGSVYCTKAALSSIIETKGVVCSISSIAGYRGLPFRSGYCASKFALQGFMESLRTELLESGAHIMWVSPGFTASNIRNVALNASGTSQGESPLNESKLMSSETCAQIILKSIAQRKRSVIITKQGKLTIWLNKLFPSWADKLVLQHFLKHDNK